MNMSYISPLSHLSNLSCVSWRATMLEKNNCIIFYGVHLHLSDILSLIMPKEIPYLLWVRIVHFGSINFNGNIQTIYYITCFFLCVLTPDHQSSPPSSNLPLLVLLVKQKILMPKNMLKTPIKKIFKDTWSS